MGLNSEDATIVCQSTLPIWIGQPSSAAGTISERSTPYIWQLATDCRVREWC